MPSVLGTNTLIWFLFSFIPPPHRAYASSCRIQSSWFETSLSSLSVANSIKYCWLFATTLVVIEKGTIPSIVSPTQCLVSKKQSRSGRKGRSSFKVWLLNSLCPLSSFGFFIFIIVLYYSRCSVCPTPKKVSAARLLILSLYRSAGPIRHWVNRVRLYHLHTL